MKLRTAMFLGVLVGLVGLVAMPAVGVDDAASDIQEIELMGVDDGSRYLAGWGHWRTGIRTCQVEDWWAPGPIEACGGIYIGGRPYHIVAVLRASGGTTVMIENR